MKDLSKKFFELAKGYEGGNKNNTIRIKNSYQDMINIFNLNIKELKEQTDLYIHDIYNKPNTNTMIFTGVDQPKKKLRSLEEFLQKIKTHMNDHEYMNKPSTQLKKHRAYIIEDLENKLRKTTTSTMNKLEKRTKILMNKETRQERLFGVRRRLHIPTETNSLNSLYNQKQDTIQHTNRTSEIQQVQKIVSEIGQVFEKMSTLVKEQNETIDAISINIDDTDMNLQEAQGELMISLKRESENREFIIKLLLITLMLCMIMIYFWT